MMSVPCSASSSTWTALSAPMDSALRSASLASSGPTVSTVISASLGALGDLQRLLDGVLVELRQQAVHRVTVGGQVLGEVTVARGVGHVLHCDYDPQAHACSPTASSCPSAAFRRQHRRLGRRLPFGTEQLPTPEITRQYIRMMPASKALAL